MQDRLLHTAAAPPRARSRRAGFSLIELLVVISIMLILVGLIVAAFASRQGPASATRITLSSLKGAAVEYEVQTTKPAQSIKSVTGGWEFGVAVTRNYLNGQYIDPADQSSPTKSIIDSGATGWDAKRDFSIEWFLYQALQNPTTRTMLIALGKEAFGDSDENHFADVVDGWGNKVIYYNPINDFNSTNQRNEGHSELLPASRTPYFASAGPDGKWGDHRQLLRQRKGESLTSSEAQDAREAEDNLYSFDQGQ